MDLFTSSDTATPPRAWNGKFPYELLKQRADFYLEILAPLCHRIELAGSLRRLQPLCKDIEFVLIPKDYQALIHRLFRFQFDSELTDYWKTKGPKQIKVLDILHHKGQNFRFTLELYISEWSYWGWTYFIRTGSAEWNKHCVFRLKDLGYTMENNKIWHHSNPQFLCPLTSEADIFKLLQCEPVHPTLRHDRISLAQAQYQYRLKHQPNPRLGAMNSTPQP